MAKEINVNGVPYDGKGLSERFRQVCETRDRGHSAMAEKYVGLAKSDTQRLIDREARLRRELGLWEMNLNGVPVSRVLNK